MVKPPVPPSRPTRDLTFSVNFLQQANPLAGTPGSYEVDADTLSYYTMQLGTHNGRIALYLHLHMLPFYFF